MNRIYADSFGNSINNMDAPEHTRYRKLFQQAFMPEQVRSWGVHLVPQVVNSIIDNFASRGKAELVSEFTIRYPFDVVYAQLGLPKEGATIFQKLAVGLMCISIDWPHASEASRKMGDYLQTLLDERREAKGEDLITMLAQAEVAGERLPDDIPIGFLRQLLNASGDTTYRSTGAMLVGLLTNPDQLDAVRGNRSLVPQVIEEALRWDGPLIHMTRETLIDVDLMGVTIPAGSKVDIVQGSANRDPSRFDDPDKFDIYRESKRHTAFAVGPHVCIGSIWPESRWNARSTHYSIAYPTCGSTPTIRHLRSSA